MNIPGFAGPVDERHLMHKMKSTSAAGIAGGLMSVALFWWRLFGQNVWRWDLLSIGITIALVKVVMLIWYRVHD